MLARCHSEEGARAAFVRSSRRFLEPEISCLRVRFGAMLTLLRRTPRRSKQFQMPASFPKFPAYTDESVHLMIVGTSHEERMGIYDDR